MLDLYAITKQESVVFADRETDILLAWNGEIEFTVYAGRFDGNYDNIDSFYHDVKNVSEARIIANQWFVRHATFNPGP